MDRPNEMNGMPISKSFYEKMNDYMQKSPTAVITSVCALFIVLILSLTIPLYFPININTASNH